MTQEEQEEELECGKPCPPENPCDECIAYWKRMERAGYYDMEKHRWTDKGWKEMIK